MKPFQQKMLRKRPPIAEPRNSPSSASSSAWDPGDASECAPENVSDDEKVKHADYQFRNLAFNKVHLLNRYDDIPESHLGLVNRIAGQPGASLEHSVEKVEVAKQELKARYGLLHQVDVFNALFRLFMNPKTTTSASQVNMMQPIFTKHLPKYFKAPEEFDLSQPTPDLLFGYSFCAFEQNGDRLCPEHICHTSADESLLLLPFLAVHMEGQWPTSESNLCVAENKAAGSSTACVNIVESLNERIERDIFSWKPKKLDSTSFSIVTNGSEARLFMTWSPKQDVFKVKHVRSYCLTEADHCHEFRKTVDNIFDWGYNDRLNEIRACVGTLVDSAKQKTKLVGGRARDDEGDQSESEGRPSKRTRQKK